VKTKTQAPDNRLRSEGGMAALNPCKMNRCLARVATVTVLLFLTTGAGLLCALVRLAVQPSTQSAALVALPHAQDGFYFRNRMWLADARTIANVMSYLFRPELSAKTNLVVNG
jgi:hypothetical protein